MYHALTLMHTIKPALQTKHENLIEMHIIIRRIAMAAIYRARDNSCACLYHPCTCACVGARQQEVYYTIWCDIHIDMVIRIRDGKNIRHNLLNCSADKNWQEKKKRFASKGCSLVQFKPYTRWSFSIDMLGHSTIALLILLLV